MAYMEVLLREDIDNLGDRGQIVRVRRGYGRNYLLPRGLAVEASAGNVRQIEFEKSVLAKREARDKAAAQEAVTNLEGMSLEFERKAGDEGRLGVTHDGVDPAVAPRCIGLHPHLPGGLGEVAHALQGLEGRPEVSDVE